MKIALIDPSLFTWPYDACLAEGLDARGHQVLLFGTSPSHEIPAAKRRFLVEHFYPGVSNDPLRKMPRAAFLTLKGMSHILSMIRLIDRLRRERPDVIHFQWTPLAVVDKHFIRRLGGIAPVLLTVHDSAPFNASPSSSLQRINAIGIMGRFDQLIVHTEQARERLRHYGIPAERLNVVPHGQLCDVGSVATTVPERDTVQLLLFGYVKPYKGIDVLLHAIAKLPGQIRQKCRLRIVGKPLMPLQPLFDLVKTLGLETCVTWDLRFVAESEIPGIMAAADIHVYPYREIDASGVLMQSLALGRPIVASNIGLFREKLVSGVHGCLVPPGDSDALSKALEPLIADRKRRELAAQAVRELGKVLPEWDAIARATEQVYLKCRTEVSAAESRLYPVRGTES